MANIYGRWQVGKRTSTISRHSSLFDGEVRKKGELAFATEMRARVSDCRTNRFAHEDHLKKLHAWALCDPSNTVGLNLPSTTAIRLSAMHYHRLERLHDQGKSGVAGWLRRDVSGVGHELITIHAQEIVSSSKILCRSKFTRKFRRVYELQKT
jgi:hypothetical protein